MSDELNDVYSILSGADTNAMQQVGPMAFVFLLLLSLAGSLFVASLYLQFVGRRTGVRAYRAFALLGVSLTAILVTIQFSLPLSLGLLGAVSITRFRVPIKEPEEIGCIMLVVAVSIACATYEVVLLGVLLMVAVVALLAPRFSRFRAGVIHDTVVVISMPESDYETKADLVGKVIGRRLPQAQLESVSKVDLRMVLSYSVRDVNEVALKALQADLGATSRQSSLNVVVSRRAAG